MSSNLDTYVRSFLLRHNTEIDTEEFMSTIHGTQVVEVRDFVTVRGFSTVDLYVPAVHQTKPLPLGTVDIPMVGSTSEVTNNDGPRRLVHSRNHQATSV